MAKNNAGDVLTGDWNPIVGCVRYSAGCKNCWFLDGIFPWQQRLGNIPPEIKADEPYYPEKRCHADSLKTKNGIIGICQHGDLFWDKVSDERVHGVLDILDEVAPKKIRARQKAGRTPPKYLLWTKRANEMLTSRYHLDQPGSCQQRFKRGCGHFLGLDYATNPRLLRYSTGLRAPRDILIRLSLYHRM